jgi:hypothetical protein
MSERRQSWPPPLGGGRPPFKPLINERNGAGRIAILLDGNDSVLGEAVRLVLVAGCGVLMSPTRDGGALSITLYVGDDRLRGYAASPEELEALLDRVADTGRGTARPKVVNPASNALGIRKGP